eukprot:3858453-Pyramimonas_sp.AAC.1
MHTRKKQCHDEAEVTRAREWRTEDAQNRIAKLCQRKEACAATAELQAERTRCDHRQLNAAR